MRPTYALAAGAALLLLAYAPALRAGFVWDDLDHIVANPRIERWSSVGEYLTEPVGRYHRPLVFFSYAGDFFLWGRSPAAYHATNVALHALNALLLAALARRSAASPPVALGAALLFALHPLQTEAVTYVSGRTDLLMTCGALAAWIAVLGPGPAWRRGALAALAASASALSKESGFALALLVPWLAWRRERRTGDRLAVALPTPVALALLLALRPATLPGVAEVKAPWATLAGAGNAIATYASLFACPAVLMVDRLMPLPATAAAMALGSSALFAALLLVGLGLWRGGWTADWVAWSVAFYLPVANLVPLYSSIADRALFTPEHNLYPVSAGLCVLVAAALGRLGARFGARRVRLAALAVLALLAARTALRNADWRDQETLFRSAVAAGSLSPRVHYDLGNAMLERADPAGAARAFESAVRLAPNDGQAWANLGIARQRQGDLERALEAERRAVALLPSDPRVRENLAALHVARGDLGAARLELSEALRLDPSSQRARMGLLALDAMGGSH